MLTVHFHKSGRTVTCEKGRHLIELCDEGQSEVRFSCRAGACGACLIDVAHTPDGLSPMSAREKRTLERIGANLNHHRLACINRVMGDLDVGEVATTLSQEARATGEKTEFEGEVAATRLLAPLVREVSFTLIRPETISFLPGQYLAFTIRDHHQVRRSYSIVSIPANDRYVTICVRSVSGGMGSNFIHRIERGDKVRFHGPYGQFTLANPARKNLLFIANGTGIAPIMSMLHHLRQDHTTRRIRLYFGVRHIDDIFYQEELDRLVQTLPDFRYTICLSQPFTPWWKGYVGRVTNLLKDEITEKMATDHEVYVCGGRSMLEDARTILSDKGFSPNDIHHENFY